MEDWPLHAYLWAGTLPEDEKEQDRILRHAEKYQASQDNLQVFFPKSRKLVHTGEKIKVLPDHWISMAPIAKLKKILMDAYISLGHCNWDKLISSVQKTW